MRGTANKYEVIIMRANVVRVVNELASHGSLDFDLSKAYDLVNKWLSKNKAAAFRCKFELVEGSIYAEREGGVRERLGLVDFPFTRKVPFDEYVYYMEGKCLAKGEMVE